ncbi:MAG: PQQ-dependent dehydrogenase, methanol/ethanol family [Novosphingobium sp.]|nr:PQQ-dependent dehydrogenase, methanol/ethanol family [Novosphingobium sp.]
MTLVGCREASSPEPKRKADERFGQRIVNADQEPQNWLTTGRDYQETRHSPLDLINTTNVKRLGMSWFHDLDTNRGQEATPIVVDGVIYTSSAWSKVQAFDGITGKLLWQFDSKVPGSIGAKACCDVVNRGVAYWDGKVYIGALDGRLIAIDAKTGRQVWSKQTVDTSKNYTITGAPRIVKGRVIIGNGGADLGVRGYVSAYDAETGNLDWRFYMVPSPNGQKDNAVSDEVLAKLAKPTWGGAPQGGGGGTAWDSFAYDPELNLLYVGTGNAGYGPRAYGDPQSKAPLDRLFVGSVLALRPETGEYVWHYQETPGDQWDYTSTQHMILANLVLDGKPRKVLMHAPKNGFFYVIDRGTGKPISAKQYSKVTWATGIDLASGRPIFNPDTDYSATRKPWVGFPSTGGAHNWPPMSFDAKRNLVYIPVTENEMSFALDPNFKPKPKGWNLGLDLFGDTTIPDDPKSVSAMRASGKSFLLAWDPIAQKEAWRVYHPSGWSGGVLSTAGDLVFQGDVAGTFIAYESKTGKKLWSFETQSAVMAAPVTWSKDGVQYVTAIVGVGASAVFGGGPLLVDEQGRPRFVNRSRVITFALDKSVKLPAAVPAPLPQLQTVPQFAAAATIAMGRQRYHRTCAYCHGAEAISGGVIPDLRYSRSIGDPDTWKAILVDGILSDNGMVGFKENFTLGELEAIRAYLIDRSAAATRRYGGNTTGSKSKDS